MLRGLYTGAAGMMMEMTQINVISNNMANVNTAGYKKDETVVKEFESMMLRRINDGVVEPEIGELGKGSIVDDIRTIPEQGSIRRTGNTYDLCIEGPGYFAVETPRGERYTRNGAFTRSAEGELVTMEGMRVLGQNGRPVQIPDGTEVTFGAQGEITVDGEQVDTLRFVEFEDPLTLLKEGENLYMAQENLRGGPATGVIAQGALEASNVNIVSEMIKMISAQRAYETNAKTVTTQDNLLDKAVNEVGRV